MAHPSSAAAAITPAGERSLHRAGLPLKVRCIRAVSGLAIVWGVIVGQTEAIAASDAAIEGVAAGELEFWRSAERMGTAGAYRAYLEAFPTGLYVKLARLALAGADGAPSAKRPPPTSAETLAPGSPSPATALRQFSIAADKTGAISFALGDRFYGPGVLTVGWPGAKRQLLLPAGEWIALAAVDSKSIQAPFYATQAPVAAQLTTTVFGKFAGARVTALLAFSSNSQPAPAAAWGDIDGCGAAGSETLEMSRAQTPYREECASLRAAADWTKLFPPAMPEVQSNLSRLGAVASGVALVSTTTFSEKKYGYLGITRVDWPAGDLASATQTELDWRPRTLARSPGREAYVKELWDWVQAYRKIAVLGFQRGLEVPDLAAGAPAITSQTSASISDFRSSALARAQ